MKSRLLALSVILGAAACSRPTIVHLTIASGSAADGIADIALDVALDGQHRTAALAEADGAGVRLPTSVNLRVHGAGPLTITASASNRDGQVVAVGVTHVVAVAAQVTDASLSLTDSWSERELDFGIVDVDAAAPATVEVLLRGEPGPMPALSLSDGDQGFAIVSPPCTAPLGPSTVCAVTVAFQPHSFGARQVMLESARGPMVKLRGVGRDHVTLRVVTTGESSTDGAVTASGTVTGVPGAAACGTDCTATLERTDQSPTVALGAATDGVSSDGIAWSGCTGSDGDRCVVAVTGSAASPTVVRGSFQLKRIHWNVSRLLRGDATGTVMVDGRVCGDSCTVVVRYGDTASVTATPDANANPGFTVAWKGAPCEGEPSSTCSRKATAAAQVQAVFSPHNYMFVTSTTYAAASLGGLDPMGGNDGFRAADAICQSLASKSELPSVKHSGKRYRAWLAVDTPPQVNALQRLSTGSFKPRGWVRTDGRPFADRLVDQVFAFPLLDEGGVPITSVFEVITGANGDGSPEPWDTNCARFTADDGKFAVGGIAGSGGQFWSRSDDIGCTDKLRLYCFGVDFDAPVTIPPPMGLYKRVFVSDGRWRPEEGGTIRDADAHCRSQAAGAGLCADAATCPFLAVMADLQTSASFRFPDTTPPVYRLDNVKVAASVGDFMDGRLLSAPDTDSLRKSAGGFPVWTGASSPLNPGTVATTCDGWSKRTGATGLQGQMANTRSRGDSQVTYNWFGHLGSLPCDEGYLLCLERSDLQ